MRSARLESVRAELGAVAALDPERSLAEATRGRRTHRAAGPRARWKASRSRSRTGSTSRAGRSPARRPRHRDRRAKRDATAVARLRAAGAVVVGITTALDDSPAHGPHAQPPRPGAGAGRFVDGLRGGRRGRCRRRSRSGAIPAAASACPAAWCGVCGLKPTLRSRAADRALPAARLAVRPRAPSSARSRTAWPTSRSRSRLHRRSGRTRRRRHAGPARGSGRGRRHAPARSALVTGATDDHVARAATALRAAGVVVVDDAVPDVRDEALEITRRYWQRGSSRRSPDPSSRRCSGTGTASSGKMLVAMAETDALLMPATTEVAPMWRESVDTDFVWQLPWSLTGSPVVVMPYGTDGDVARRGPDRQPARGTTTSCSPCARSTRRALMSRCQRRTPASRLRRATRSAKQSSNQSRTIGMSTRW